MPPDHRKGDIGSGHGCHFPPTPATGGSPDVYVNGSALMRQGDSFAPHACVAGHAGPHDRALAGGSATVFVNGKLAGRKGDAIGCGGSAATASVDVYIGDKSGGGDITVEYEDWEPCKNGLSDKPVIFASGFFDDYTGYFAEKRRKKRSFHRSNCPASISPCSPMKCCRSSGSFR